MNINTKNLVSITDANQNFSKVARLVDENGSVIILKNNEFNHLQKHLIIFFHIKISLSLNFFSASYVDNSYSFFFPNIVSISRNKKASDC